MRSRNVAGLLRSGREALAEVAMKRSHWRWLLSKALLGAAIVWGCNGGPTPIAPVGTNPPGGSEVWPAWSPGVFDPTTGSLGPDTLVIGYNIDNFHQGWSWSIDQGQTWTSNTTNSIDAGMGTTIRGDPVMVADHLGNVVYVDQFVSAASQAKAKDGSLGDSDRDIAMVSTDGGRTFKSDHLAIVNDGHCSDGDVDQPAAGFDYTTFPPTLWVAYRHNGTGFQTGCCVRRGFINPAIGNRITWLEDSLDLQNFHGEAGRGIGAVRVQAGDGAVTVVYTNTEDMPQTTQGASLRPFATEALTSFDNGHSWQTKSRMFHSDQWANSVLSDKVQMGGSVRNFDFVRAPDGTSYVIAQYSQWQMRLFRSRLEGAGSTGNTDAAWSEYCPSFEPGTQWTPIGVECPSSNWTFVRQDPPGIRCSDRPIATQNTSAAVSCSLAWPMIAADDQSRLVLSYYESDDTNQFFHVKVWSNRTPRSPTAPWDSTIVRLPSGDGGAGTVVTFGDAGEDFDPLNFAACAPPASCGTRSLGDYEGMTVRFGFGAPGCGGPGTFFPTWTTVNPPNNEFIETVGIAP